MFDRWMQNMVEKILEGMSDTKRTKLLPMVNNFSWLTFQEIAERAKTGVPLSQPEGSTRKNFMDFRDLVFIPAQLATFPLMQDVPVDTSITIGPMAKKPLHLPIPLLITGMGYGVSVSKAARLALCKASALTNTAANSGEAGFVPWEKELCHKYIVQYNRARWGNQPEDLKKADAIEVRIGQGASASDGFTIPADQMDAELREHLNINPDQDAEMPNRFPDIDTIEDLKAEVENLKKITDGVPVGVKIGAGDIEKDIDAAIYCGFDFITLDGGEGGTAGSLEITINNFCIPLVMGISKAAKYLEQKGMKDKISLIAAGGAHTPGDFLKAMALGADAVYIGQPLLIAMVYQQAHKMPVGTNPVEMFVYGGKETEKLDWEEAAQSIANFINASVQEMVLASRCLNKNDLKMIDRTNLRALKEEVAKATGTELAYS